MCLHFRSRFLLWQWGMVEVAVITKIVYAILIVAGCFCSCMGAALGDAVEVRYISNLHLRRNKPGLFYRNCSTWTSPKINIQAWHHSACPNVSFCYPLSETIFIFCIHLTLQTFPKFMFLQIIPYLLMTLSCDLGTFTASNVNCACCWFICSLDIGRITIKINIAKRESHLWQIFGVVQNQSPAFCSKIHNLLIYCLFSVSG